MRYADRGHPSWLMFSLKMLVALLWIAGAAFAAAALLRETPRTLDIFAAAFLFLAPIAWGVIKIVDIKRADEMQRQVVYRGLIQGLLMASLWASLLLAGNVLSSLFLGDGEVNVSGLMQQAVTFCAMQPAIAFLMSELISFALVRSYARREA